MTDPKAAASPEPVAWMYHNTETDGNVVLMERLKIDERYIETALYAHPPAAAERIIAEHSGLLAGLTRYSSGKWGIMENPMGQYLRASDVKAALNTEQTMHTAWRKRAQEAEARLAVYNTNGFVDADALAARFITLQAAIEALKAERDAVVAALEQIADPSAFIHSGDDASLARRYEEIAQAALAARKEEA